MNRHYATGGWRYRFLYGFGIQGQGIINIHDHRDRTNAEYGFKTGHKSERRHDHFVPGSNTQRGESRRQGRSAAGSQLGKTALKTVTERLFQFAGFPYIFTGPIKTITHEDTRF